MSSTSCAAPAPIRSQQRQHDRLASFGAGKDRGKSYWQGLIRQAVAGGYLWIDIETFGSLKLTAKGEAVDDGTERFFSREIQETKGERSRRRDPVADGVDADFDADLFASLKALRRDLADAANVPAYVIFSDATLQDMCRSHPTTADALAQISGVGPKKLANFGATFLGAIRAHGGQAR